MLTSLDLFDVMSVEGLVFGPVGDRLLPPEVPQEKGGSDKNPPWVSNCLKGIPQLGVFLVASS